MSLKDIFSVKKRVITAELGPPKGVDMSDFFRQAQHLKSVVDAVNVTDQQSAIMKLGSMAACHLLIDQGLKPIMQMTVRDKNQIAIQSELLSAYVLGIRDVLVLTGDPIHIGDHPQAKPVFDMDVVGLMKTIRKLESGSDLTDHKLSGNPSYSIAAAMNPCVEDINIEMQKTENKIRSGTDFFQTQAVYDCDKFLRFMDMYEKKGFKAPVLAGIIPIKSVKMARFMNEKIPGITIPEDIIERFENCSNAKESSVELSLEIMRKISDRVQGFHIMAIGWEDLIPSIVKGL